jgi:hypothetical protein
MSQIDPANTLADTLTEEQIAQILQTGKWAPDPALTLVLRDTDSAETAKAAKQWIAGWNSASILYQSTTTPKFWEGTQVERANVPFYTVAKVVNSLTPQIVNGLFYDDPPFIFQPRPGTSQDTVEAVADIIGYQLKEIGFKEQVRLGVMNVVLYGTNIWKWGWDSKKISRTYFALDEKKDTIPSEIPGQPDVEFHDPNAPLVERTEEIRVEQPRFENITSIRDVLVDPTLRVPDITKGKFVIHRLYLTYNELIALKDTPGYDIPSEQEVISWFTPPEETALPDMDERTGISPMWDMRADPRWEKATIDPFNQPLEVLERWDKEKVIIVVQRKKVICNGKNPYSEIPFLSCNFWDVPGAFYGLGVGRTVGSEQRLQMGIVNTWLDSVALSLSGVYVRKRTNSIPTQSIRISPGRVVELENVEDLKPLARPPAVPEAAEHLGMSASRVEQNSGAGEISSQGQAGSSGHSNIARTATGAAGLLQGQGIGISDLVEKFSCNVFLPFLYRVMEMNRNLLPAETIKRILNDELQKAYLAEGTGTIEDIRKARMEIEIQAGAKLADRRAVSASLPLLTSYLGQQFVVQNLATQGLKVDQKMVVKTIFEAAGFKSFYSLIVPMTDQEKQQSQANSPAAMNQSKIQAESQMALQKYQAQSQLRDQENIAKAGMEVLRKNLEATSTPEAMTGQVGANEGFGSNL